MIIADEGHKLRFQCPLSGLVGCHTLERALVRQHYLFQCPLSGLVGCNDNRLKIMYYVLLFQCPLSGLVGGNDQRKVPMGTDYSFNAL